MKNLIGVSSTNASAGKLNFQDCFRYDFMFFSSQQKTGNQKSKKEDRYFYGQDRHPTCDKLDDLDNLEDLNDIDYLLY